MAELVTQDLELSVSDGTTMGAYLARPAGDGPFPGIVLFQEIFGVNPHIRSVADRFAASGYAVLAPDLFHRSAPGFQSGYDDFGPGMQHLGAMTDDGATADARAAYDWLRTAPFGAGQKIAAMGFCMGGRLAFMANRTLPVQASVSFYGGGIAQSEVAVVHQIQAPALLFWGAQDPMIPAEDAKAVADALREAGKSFVNVEFSDASHGFFCDARGSYHAPSARQAWAIAQAFLAEHLSR